MFLRRQSMKSKFKRTEFIILGYFNISNKLYCETHARAAKAAEQLGQQTAASIRAAAASPSGVSLANKPASPIQPPIPQANTQVCELILLRKFLRRY